jgi:imidazoleglycerol phosphate dehydratase HisB
MKCRIATIKRKTFETNIIVKLNLDGTGKYQIDTGLGFFNHMLELFAKHSLIDLNIKAKGDLYVDEHHIIEDIGICLGQAIGVALGEKRGIGRYGFWAPLDEAVAQAIVDLSGRPYLVWNAKFKREKIGDVPTELFEDFFQALANNLKANIHINLPYGRNEHHMIEAIFKAFARSLRMALTLDKRQKKIIPTTKGKL